MVILLCVLLVIPAAAGSPTVTGITPPVGLNTSTISITDLNGTGFLSGATVLLTPVNANPVHIGSIQNGSGGALLDTPFCVFVYDNYAYVTSAGSNALEIVDISNPASPLHAGSIINGSSGALLNSPYGVYVSGNYAYIASAGSNALEIVDISNPASPLHAGSIVDGSSGALLNSPYGVYVSGNYAYVTGYYSSALEIVDVTNPVNPVHTSSIVDGGGSVPCLSLPTGLYVAGNYTYVASDGSDALEIVNVTKPANPEHAGRLDDGSGVAPFLDNPLSVFISGNYAYVASSFVNRLEIVDVTDPANPVHKGSIQDGTGGALLNRPYNVFISGKYAYIASQNSNALEIIDIGTITAASVNVAIPTNITCTFNLTGALPGRYNVVVTNTDGSFGTLSNGFTVIGSTPTTSPTPTPTPTPTPSPTLTPSPYISGDSDSDPTPVPTLGRRSTVTVNVGGDSSVCRANVTGTGHSDLIITGMRVSGPGKGISPAPESVYEYIDLVPARYSTIDEANISFTVTQSWIDAHQLTRGNIIVYHLTNTTWMALPTFLVKSDTLRSNYMAVSPGFSRFAITGNRSVTSGSLVKAADIVLQTSANEVQATPTPPRSTVTSTPVALQTTEPLTQHATQPESGLPVTHIGIGIAGVIILIGLAVYLRRQKTTL